MWLKHPMLYCNDHQYGQEKLAIPVLARVGFAPGNSQSEVGDASTFSGMRKGGIIELLSEYRDKYHDPWPSFSQNLANYFSESLNLYGSVACQ